MKRIPFIFLSVFSLFGQYSWSNEINDNIPKLIVTGEALLHKPADQLQLSVSVVTQKDNAKNALEENSEKVQKVIDRLTELDIKKSEISTHNFNIEPVYSQRPIKNESPDWHPKIVGYRVVNSLQIKTDQISNAGAIIDAVVQAGANQINTINFNLSDSRTHRSEAIAAAAENAMQDATELAKALNVKLGRILTTALDNANVHPLNRFQPMMLKAANYSTPIEPGDVDVKANVTVVFQIIK